MRAVSSIYTTNSLLSDTVLLGQAKEKKKTRAGGRKGERSRDEDLCDVEL